MFWSFANTMVHQSKSRGNGFYIVLAVLPVMCVLASSLLSGLISDTSSLGKFRIIKSGSVLVFLGAVLYCIDTLVEEHLGL